MRKDDLEGAFLLGPAIDNSQVVRERDPRANRDIGRLLLVVGAIVAGLVTYAWPHLELRREGIAAEELSRERERLLEENRKLRLERASLENLRRVEAIAERELGLRPPAAEQTVVVDLPRPVPAGMQVAGGQSPGGEEPAAGAASPTPPAPR